VETETNIDDLINEVSQQLENQIAQSSQTEITKKTDIIDEDALVDIALTKNDEIEKMANDAFKLFYKNLSNQTDHSSSSKEQMLEALKVRVELNKTLVEMAKVKKKQQAGVGVLINTVPQSQVGIDLDKLRNTYEE
jgi:phosphatidate phosphatase PAH1